MSYMSPLVDSYLHTEKSGTQELNLQFENNYIASILKHLQKKYYALKDSISEFKYKSSHYNETHCRSTSEMSLFGYSSLAHPL